MLLALVCSLITISVTIDFWAHYIVIDKYYCADTSLLNDLSYLVQIARTPPFLDAMIHISCMKRCLIRLLPNFFSLRFACK